jgi:Flp pilus assembly protein TadD
MTQWSAYFYYVRLFLWPDALIVDRLDYPLARSLLEPRTAASLACLLAVGVLAWRARRELPALSFAAIWYFATLAAESSFFPLAEPVNEHRPYLAMLGLGTATGLGLSRLARAIGSRYAASPAWILSVVLAGLTGVLGAATHVRSLTWSDDLTLWRDAIAKAPANPRAWLNAGHAAMGRGQDAEAEHLLLEARRLSPCYSYVQMNLSALAARRGDLAASLAWADEAVSCQPGQALAHHHRASALERFGRRDEALAAYRRVTELNPGHAEAWRGQGRLLERREAWAEAAGAYARAGALAPTDPEPHMLLALVLHHRLADIDGAIEQYRSVLAIAPAHYGAHYQLAVALLARGDVEAARSTWRAFVRLAAAIGDRASIENAPEPLRLAAVSR